MPSKKDRFLQQSHASIERLSRKFGSYATGIEKTDVRHYLSQFEAEHMPSALKMLEHVDYYSCSRQISLVEELVKIVKGHTNPGLRDVLFCPINAYSGSRADVIQNLLKHKLGITTTKGSNFDEKFIRMKDLAELSTDLSNKTIVFVDDFIGSGTTMINAWGLLQQWENPNHRYLVGVLVAYEGGIQRIKQETFSRLEITPAITLPDKLKIFHDDNPFFTQQDKLTLQQYCERIVKKPDHKYGYKNTQSVVIFQERAPNNTIPILHQSTDDWTPLFKRLY